MHVLLRLGVLSVFFFAASANAQEPSWNDEQKAVWAAVEQSWVDYVAENGKWPADYLHDRYVAWGDGDAAPRYKAASIAWSRFGDESNTILMYEVSPAAIVVENGTAVVHYHATTVSENNDGKRTQRISRITEVLIREGRSWKWLAGVDYEPKLND